MLSRRHIRIKVLQALYAFHHNNDKGMIQGEKRLRESILDIYRLYLFEMRALLEIHRYADDMLEIKRQRRLPTQEDLNPNRRFVENRFLKWLSENEQLNNEWEKEKIRFGDDRELLRKIFREFQEVEQYEQYMHADQVDLAADKKIVKYLYGEYLSQSETLHQLYEERSMHWADDLDAAQMMVVKTIKKFGEESNEYSKLPSLLKDTDDLDFALKLFRKSIQNDEEFENRIREKAQNWETERIALVDILLMKLALAELTTFSQIPVKVTLNEYIELSKQYSTPKSGNFINGILDKIKDQMLESGEVRKIGRGLL